MNTKRFFTQATFFLLFIFLLIFALVQGQALFVPFTYSIIFAFIALPMSDRWVQLRLVPQHSS